MSVETGTGRRRPTGRRPGDSGTRDAILDAALAMFAERGYDRTSVRAIAAEAGVDPALVRHFYTDKDTLMTITLTSRTPIAQRLAEGLEGDWETLGLRLSDTYLRLWEEPDTRPIVMALVKSAMTSPQAAALLPQIFIASARSALPNLDEARSAGFILAVSHLFGTAMARHILQIPALQAMTHDELVASVGPVIQHYLD
jgi:AcrR family transcriptional regulator